MIQEHHARSHHYDLRLEIDGVLVSWAVPKGIPETPAEKRLAVHTEDHPLEYATFEGTIPKGQYGAGEMTIWDTGTWSPLEGDAPAALAKGKLKFRLNGRRLSSNFVLARMAEEPNWLLRLLPEKLTPPSGMRRPEIPSFIEPQLAQAISKVPSGSDWLHELKFDGYRLIAVKKEGEASFFTRNGYDWTDRFPALTQALAALPPQNLVLDGEAVVFDQKGRTDFGGLQAALKTNDSRKIIFIAFDLLHLEGESLRDLPLTARLKELENLFEEDTGIIRRSKVWPGKLGPDLFKQAAENGLEGIISKTAMGRYLPGQRRDWVKSKSRSRQEFVICGYTPPKGSRKGIGALLLASHENGKLIPRGKVGTGFSERDKDFLLEKFAPLKTNDPLLDTSEEKVTWIRPVLVAEIEFAELTREGSIRQGSFIGLREDKPAEAVRLETVPAGAGNQIAGVKITHPDRLVFPADGIPKIEIARHYEAVAEYMVPYVFGRPLSILRAPDGITGETFFQKNFPTHLPPGVKSHTLADGTSVFSVTDAKGLVSLAQFGTVEIHPWGCQLDKPDAPDLLIWDLDPDPAITWKETLGAAFLLRDVLGEAGLEPMVKTSGGKGLHLVLRIRRTHDWETMREFTKNVARAIEALAPAQFVTISTKAKRKGKIFIDWMRNSRGSTCVAPWVPRARPGAPISMPVSWEDLPEVPSQGFTLREPPQTPPEWLNPKPATVTKAILAKFAKP